MDNTNKLSPGKMRNEELNVIIDKFRHADPDKFESLCHMHLSFIVELTIEDLEALKTKPPMIAPEPETKEEKWNFGLFTAKKFRSKGIMYGAPLTQEGICQIYQIIEFLSKDANIRQEGLFRKSGKMLRQNELRNKLNSGTPLRLDSSHFSVHDCASVLKAFLSELSEPLLTESHFSVHCQIAKMTSRLPEEQLSAIRSRQLQAVQLLLLMLPAENRKLLQDLFTLLHRVHLASAFNRMDSNNLATVFAPHLICTRKVSPAEQQQLNPLLLRAVAFMIEVAPAMFEVPSSFAQDVVIQWKDMQLNKTVITSPCTPKNNKKFNQEDNNEPLKTVISFCDHKLSQEADSSDLTKQSLLDLYAHLQNMPDSAKKKKLVKQFNKENCGLGPIERTEKSRTQSIREVIKEHLLKHNKREVRLSPKSKNEKNRVFRVRGSENSYLDDTNVVMIRASRYFPGDSVRRSSSLHSVLRNGIQHPAYTLKKCGRFNGSLSDISTSTESTSSTGSNLSSGSQV